MITPSFRLGLALALLLPSTAALAQNVGQIRETGLAPEVVLPLATYDRDLATNGATFNFDVRNHFTIRGVHADQLVQIKTNLGTFNAELLAADAPLTVANFKAYLATDSTTAAAREQTYDNTFFHRSIDDFVIQCGGFRSVGGLPRLTARPAVVNEFKVANTRGTLAMAKLPDLPDSATNQWFINLKDNRDTLDNQNGGFTVFARILGKGMDFADTVAALPTYNLKNIYPSFDGSLTDVPLHGVTPDQQDLLLTNLVTIQSARLVPLQPPATGAGPSVLTYTATTDNPALAGLALANGRLTVTPAKITGRAIVTVRASEAGGAFAESSFTLTRSGRPTIHVQLPGTTTAAFGAAATLAAQTNIWPVGTIRWERKAPGAGTAFTPIAADDPLFSGEDTESLVLALDDATAPATTFANLQGSLFRYVLTNPFGTVTSRPTKLRITTQKVGFSAQPAALLSRDLGATATFTVTALPAAANTPVSYLWQRLPAGQKTWLDLVNSTESAPTPFTGATTRTLSVKLDDLSLDGSRFRCVIRTALADAPPPVARTGTATTKPSTLRIIAARRTVVTAESAPLFGLTPAEGVTFAARGLPKGLTLDPVTGVLSGTPSAKPGVYRVTVTTRGPAGVSSRLYQLEVVGLSGANAAAYEAFLAAEDQPPCAKLALKLTPTGAFTGTLAISEDAKPLAFRGSVIRATSGQLSLATPLILKRSGSPAGRAYRLTDLQITSGGLFTVALEARATATGAFTALAAARSVLDEDDEEIGNPGTRLGAYTRTSPAPWANVSAYTLALTAPAPLDPETETRAHPGGSGYATAAMSPEGRLTLRGKLADGTSFTAVLSSDIAGTYRLFARPYGATPGAYLIAELPLRGVTTVNPQNSQIFSRFSVRHDLTNANPALRFDDGTYAFWQKPSTVKTPGNYLPGFGPLGLTARLEPWLYFGVAELGLVVASDNRSGRIALSLSGEALSNAAPNARALPTEIKVNFADATFADATPPDPSGLTGRLNAATGFFSGKFTLTDPGARNRVITYEGVFIVPRSAVGGTVTAEGFALIPALPGSTPTTPVSARVRFRDPRTPPATP